MSLPQLEQTGTEGHYRLAGELSFETVPALLERGERLFERERQLWIDLAGISRADSAGLALLIEWARRARQSGAAIHFINLPEQMRDIVRVSGLDNVLPFGGHNAGTEDNL